MSRADHERLRNLTAGEIERALLRDGFEKLRKRGKGTHRRFRHPDGRRVTVPYSQAGETFSPKTLRSMIVDQAGWSEDDLRRLGLLK